MRDFRIIAMDLKPPETSVPLRFEQADMGQESSCRQIIDLLRETQPFAVVHLAFVIDPVRTGVLDREHQWQINVAGTARVMEAISVVNRTGGSVRKFIYPSSVSAYGSHLPNLVTEDYPLGGHTLPYAVHKREADQVVQARADSLGDCRTYLLRPHIFVGASMQNYLISILRNNPYGTRKLGRWVRQKGWRLPAILPYGDKYLETRFQYVHVDDVARLIAWILQRPKHQPGITVLNVAGRGEPLSFRRCTEIAGTELMRVPGKISCRVILELGWLLGVSCVPPQAIPYFTGTYTMDTSRLRCFLGGDYERVIRYTVEEALADSISPEAPAAPQSHEAATAEG
jgi:nucleoside-diphosphate-sugar epimerase